MNQLPRPTDMPEGNDFIAHVRAIVFRSSFRLIVGEGNSDGRTSMPLLSANQDGPPSQQSQRTPLAQERDVNDPTTPNKGVEAIQQELSQICVDTSLPVAGDYDALTEARPILEDYGLLIGDAR